ncbi:MAG: hypothetical protein E7Y34_01435 [Mycoplasma sp.]|nr:hypothetical protein [Mycoplasma sp.]
MRIISFFKRFNYWVWTILPFGLVGLCVGGFFIYKYYSDKASSNIKKVDDRNTLEKKEIIDDDNSISLPKLSLNEAYKSIEVNSEGKPFVSNKMFSSILQWYITNINSSSDFYYGYIYKEKSNELSLSFKFNNPNESDVFKTINIKLSI